MYHISFYLNYTRITYILWFCMHPVPLCLTCLSPPCIRKGTHTNHKNEETFTSLCLILKKADTPTMIIAYHCHLLMNRCRGIRLHLFAVHHEQAWTWYHSKHFQLKGVLCSNSQTTMNTTDLIPKVFHTWMCCPHTSKRFQKVGVPKKQVLISIQNQPICKATVHIYISLCNNQIIMYHQIIWIPINTFTSDSPVVAPGGIQFLMCVDY